MQIKISSTDKLRGTVILPSSKSISNRALVINALAGNTALPENVSDCDDTNVMIKWLTAPTAEIHSERHTVDIGAAGTAMRFSTALLSVTEGTHIITGTERMKNRPIAVLVDALRSLGADVQYVEKDGYPPLRITGNPRLAGGSISLPGNVSSQYISALLMIGPSLREGITLTLTDNIISRPYINMTLAMMRDFGAEADWTSEDTIVVGPKPYSQRTYLVESDWSASSYWYEMVALSDDTEAEIILPGLFETSLQGDSKVADIFRHLGVETIHNGNDVVIRKRGKVAERLDYDFVEQPDLAQTFVVTCCALGVPFHFTGLQSLKIKETDRIEALKAELRKLGYIITDRNDSQLLWDGQKIDVDSDAEVQSFVQSDAIDTYEDHRMAMCFAPVALRFQHITINNPQVVSKSYPKYWDNLQTVGFQICGY